jgi:hypothetical protein
LIPDKLFKALVHQCKGYDCFGNGNSVEPGYKPDYVLRKNNDYIILESENSSSRKTFVGGLIKAAHFLSGDKTGSLVFVIVPKPNTTDWAIARHLKKYLDWVRDKTNLRDVYVIEASTYYQNDEVLKLLSKSFLKVAKKV